MTLLKKGLYCIFALTLSLGILYADILYSFPSEIMMHEDEIHQSSLGAGVYIGDVPKSVCTVDNANGITPLESGEYEATLKLANTVPFKKIRLRVTASQNVYASGELIGLRLHNNGLIVTGTSDITCNNKASSPAKNAGISPGDVILEINGKRVLSSEDVAPLLSETSSLTVLHNNTIKKITVTPVKDDTDGKLKLGIWARDSTAGVGTMTFFDTTTSSYGALGHSISDSDTGVLFDIAKGSIEKSHVISVTKGTTGTPGEICGSFSSADNIIGTVEKNCEAGVFGKISALPMLSGTSYPVGVMSQVKEGQASILSTVDDTVKEYEILILRSMPFGSATKGMMIEVTDKELLSKTGGIVQGMSGSPILQDGKIIGAVTHVLVNDPTRGYGIFIENMLSEAEKIK